MDQVETLHTSSSWREPAVFRSTMRDPETSSELIWGLAALEQRRQRTRNHLAKIAPRREGWITSNKYYYELLARFSIPGGTAEKGVSVRCDTGNLLAAVRPSDGKGIDICAKIVEIAQQRNHSISQSLSETRKSFGRHSDRARNSTTFYLTISATQWMHFRRSGI